MSDAVTAFDILEKWAQFTHFDPNRTKFNLLSSEYRYNNAGKTIQALSNGYDPGGEISAIYAKSVFTKILRDQKISLYDLFSAPENLKDVSAMWDVFQSAEMAEIEQHFLIGIEKLIQQVLGGKMLTGTIADDSKEQSLLPSLLTAAASVAEELGKCNVELFTRGGAFMPTTRFNTHIHIFDRLSVCLLAIEAAADGIYLCYITCHGTSDGYFTFLLKSNGNVLSINERADEVFIGQHTHSRNARWTENKKTRLFPYQFIIGGEDFDYKGYARKQIIDDGQLDFFKLGADAYMPIILAMVMLTNRYTTTGLDTIPQKYVDSMLPTNLNQIALAENALMKVEKSGIAAIHKEFSFGFTLEDVLSGAAGAKFDHTIGNDGLAYNETGYFTGENQLFVDLWGEGFQYDPSTLLNRPLLTALPGPECDDIPVEFVGSERRMQMQAYFEARTQLAAYIRKQMMEEYVQFGGTKAVFRWYLDAIRQQEGALWTAAARATQFLDGDGSGSAANTLTGSPTSLDDFIKTRGQCAVSTGKYSPYTDCESRTLNDELPTKKGRPHSGIYKCAKTGTLCSLFVKFIPRDWKDIELLTGVPVPKILKGWKLSRSCTGNPLLSMVDPVSQIGTPFEQLERRHFAKQYYGEYGEVSMLLNEYSHPANLSFAIGFSKRGLTQTLKENQI